MRIYLFLALTILCRTISGQTEFTPYDDIPGVIKSYKPALEDHFPGWGRMLYQYPVDFNELTALYEADTDRDREDLAAINRYYKLWRRHVGPWVRDDGSIFVPDLANYHETLRKTQLNANQKGAGSKNDAEWTFLGPKETFWLNESGLPTPPNACPWQVNVYSFDVAATDNNILYCGTETGFVNKTTDQGMTWELCAYDYYFGGAVTATVVHPLDANIVYVAAGNQVHKTTDGGLTWTPLLEAGALFHADRLRIDPDNPEKILAAATDGVYITTDGGENWSKPWAKQAYDVEIKADDNSILFAITKDGNYFSVAVSYDGGISFETDPLFPAGISDVSGGLLAVTPADPDMLLAVMLSADNTPYLYEADLSSGEWELLAEGQTGGFGMNNGQGYFDLVLEISPLNANVIFTGTTTLFRSTNGGNSFVAIGGYYGAFPVHPDIQDMRMLPNGETWVSTDGGFTLTTDNFTSTMNYSARNNGLVGSDFWGFDQGWNEDIVVGGRYHNGNTAIADFYGPKALRMGGAESPTGWVLQGKNRHVAFNDLGNGWILPPAAEAQHEGRFIFSKYPNMDEYGGRRGNMVFHPNFYGQVYLGEGNGFWRSLDMGVSWDLLHDFGSKMRYLQISYHNPDVLYADVIGLGLCRSGDGGESWETKPALTGGQYGNAYWKGKLHFAISPYDEDVIYACLQNGTWSSDIGEVYRSGDGGDTWEDWTGSLSEYTKCLVIQPAAEGGDLVYLFTNARNGQQARVFMRSAAMDDWEPFDNNYPAGMAVNMALPFFRDSKLRVGGGAGVWESPLAEQEFPPIINPWVEKSFYNCMLDTLYFDDHSILNHEGTSWHWEIVPEPEYISDPDIRNPKVVLGEPGTYSVTFTVVKDGVTHTRDLPGMITATTCPSIEDCTNPAEVPKEMWELLYVDSEETNYPGLAVMAFDGDPATIWHTRWSTGSDPYPHEMQVDMGQLYKVYKFINLNRQDGPNGRIKEYELYIAEDTLDWGDPVSTGEFENTAAPQTIAFAEPPIGRYWRLVALSEVNGNAWASAAEFSVVGCTDLTSGVPGDMAINRLRAYPVPSQGRVTLPLPGTDDYSFTVLGMDGRTVSQGSTGRASGSCTLNLEGVKPGQYLVVLTDSRGRTFRARVIME